MLRTVSRWLDQLRDPDERASHRAVLKLGGLQPKDAWMVPDLVTALDDRDTHRRFWALIALSCLARTSSLDAHAAAVAARVAALARSDRTFGNRQAALSVLEKCPSQAEVTLPIIVRLARDDRNRFVRADALQALGALGQQASSAASVLVTALGDRDSGVRWAAAIALKRVPVATASDVTAIRRAASEHPDRPVRDQLAVVVRLLSTPKPRSKRPMRR